MNQLRRTTLVNLCFVAMLCVVLLDGCGGDSPKALVASARDYVAKGDYGAAVIQLRNALQKEPDNSEARYLLGTALVERRDPEGAVKELRKALELGYPPAQVVPALARALVSAGDTKELLSEFGNVRLADADAQAALKTVIGHTQLALGKEKEAEAAFAAALAAKADFAEALVGMATIRATSGDIAAANKIVDGVLMQSGAPPEAALLKAQLLVAEGQSDAARTALEKVLQAKPDYLPARYRLTGLLIAANELEPAAAQVVEIRKISKLDAWAYYYEAVILTHKNDLPAAREAIQQIMKVNSVHVPTLVLAGEIEFRAHQYNESQGYLRRALSIAPAQPYAQRLLAANYLRLGSPARALEVLQAPLSRGYGDPALMAIAGEAYLAMGDLPKAAQYFAQTTVLDPKNAAARTRLGQVRFAEGDTEGAIRDLEAATALESNVASADLALITTLLRQKKFDEALAAVGRLERKQPDSALVNNLKGIVYLSKRDVPSARASFEHALQIQWNYMPAVTNLAQLDRAEKKPDAARNRYEVVLKKEPGNEQALLGLAGLVQSLGGDQNEIESLLKKAVTANPQSMPPRVAMATFYARKGDNRQALLAAQEANAAMPTDPRTLDLLGQVQQAAGEPAQAVETFNKLVAARPGTIEPLFRLVGALVAVKDYDKAVDKLREILTISPGLFEAHREIAAIHFLNGHPELALKEIKAMEGEQPDDTRGYELEGEYWAGQRKWPEAEAAFTAAQKRAPANGMIAAKLYASRVDSGKRTEADAAAEKWLREHPKDVTLHLYLGDRSLRVKDYKLAVRHYQAIVAVQPDNPAFLNNLAWASGEVGDPKAISYAEKAATLAPDSAAILDTLGMLLLKRGDVNPGLENLRKAAQLAPNQGDIRLHLAKGLIRAGDKEAARKELDALAQVSSQPSVKSGIDSKGGAAQKSTAAPAAAKAPLICNPDCAAETAALLKTL